MSVLWSIDPVSEDATNVELALVGTVSSVAFSLIEMDLTPPDVEPMYAMSADTEGDPFVDSRFRNRTISLSLLARASTAALLQTGIYGVQQKLDKLRREGGTLKFTTQTGAELVGDVNYARFKPEFAKELYGVSNAMRFTLEFDCKPLFRGTPVLQNDHTETALPCLIFTETSLAGDVFGLGKLVVDEDQGVDQWWVVWGVQSRYYDSAATAALFYEAEGRTALGSTSATAGPTGASGSGSNVMRNTSLTLAYQAIVSTQTTGSGAHLSHVGNYRVFARVQVPITNTGTVSVALQWSEGDFRRYTTNAPYVIDATREGGWVLTDLGQVQLSKVPQGTQRWEGRVLAKSTIVGDDIDFDCLFLVPTAEGSGEASALARVSAALVFSARDEFDQSAGNLNGKTAPVGGNWVTSGSTTDFTVDATNHWVTRGTGSDAGPRWAISGASALTAQLVQADVHPEVADGPGMGIVARWTDSSNHLFAYIDSLNPTLILMKVVAGTQTNMAAVPITGGVSSNIWYTISVAIDTQGRWQLWLGNPTGTPAAAGSDPVLATGGTLASGKFGLYDINPVATLINRFYNNFLVSVPAMDAAVFASQSLELRSDRVIREDAGGTLWQSPSKYEGDYLRVPPAGKEARTVRFIVKASRNDPLSSADSGVDDISARLTYTPRYLVLPS